MLRCAMPRPDLRLTWPHSQRPLPGETAGVIRVRWREHMGDVEVSVTMHVDVPLVSKVVASARAGPSACD